MTRLKQNLKHRTLLAIAFLLSTVASLALCLGFILLVRRFLKFDWTHENELRVLAIVIVFCIAADTLTILLVALRRDRVRHEEELSAAHDENQNNKTR